MGLTDKANEYTDEEMNFLREKFKLTDEEWAHLRFVLIEAWRDGYRTAVEHHMFGRGERQ